MSYGNLSSNPLNGQHLRIIWPNRGDNPNGLIGPLKGGLVIDYLADRFHFTYNMIRAKENQLDIPVGGRGIFSYLVNGESDLLVYGVSFTPERQKIIDITTPWYYGTIEFLIPVLDDVANINAVMKPFQWMVWLLMLVSIVVVISVLYQLEKYENHTFRVAKGTDAMSQRNTKPDSKIKSKAESESLYLYVFGNLLSQGGVCKWKRLPFRLVAGAWTLAAFVFVQSYNSTLFTYVIKPIRFPLIYSAYDIAKDPSVALFVRKAGTVERVITDPNGQGIYTKLRERLNSVPNSRCTNRIECVNHVKQGLKNIYLESYLSLVDIIKMEYDTTGSCKMEVARDPLVSVSAGFGLPKNSPFTNAISKGIMELFENGLLDQWDLWDLFMPQKCLRNIKADTKKTKNNEHVSLSLKNLSGSFVVLAVGFSLSMVAFICEQLVALLGKTFRKGQ